MFSRKSRLATAIALPLAIAVLVTARASSGRRLTPPPASRQRAVSEVVSVEPTLRTEAQKRRDKDAATRVEAILAVQGNFGGVLSPDGRRVLFRSERDGVAELYLGEVAHPAAPAIKLVPGPEPVGSAVFTLDGKAILFRRDSGADENFHIFRIHIDGTGLTDLTPGEPLWRDTPLLPRERPETMVYSARKTTDLASMVLVHDLLRGESRMVYKGGAGAAIDITPDGTRVLWVEEAAAGGHALLEIDLASGKSRPVSPSDGRRADVTAAAYAPDGRRIFVATDDGIEAHFLFALDGQTLRKLAEYRQQSPASAEVRAVVPSPRGDRLAILVDAGNHSTVHVLDASTLEVKADVATPLGTTSLGINTEIRLVFGAGTFTPDGSRFEIGLSTPDHPNTLYLADATTGALAPLRQDEQPAVASLPPIRTSIETVTAFDGLSIPVNLYLPKSLEPGKKLPTLVFFHGGPDANTDLGWNSWARVFTTFGFALVEPNIRGSTGFGRAYAMADDKEKRLDALKDMESVNRWARRQSFCDPDRIIVYGASFGGYLVLMALTRQPSLWSAGVDLAGPADLTMMMATRTVPGRYLTEVGDPQKDAKLIASLSPIHDADKIVAPLFVYQGQNDDRVPRAQADAIVGALRRRNIPVEYMVPQNEGHTVGHRENEVEFLTRVIRFLDEQQASTRVKL